MLDYDHNGYVSLTEFETWIKRYLPEFFVGDGKRYRMALSHAYKRACIMSKAPRNASKEKKSMYD